MHACNVVMYAYAHAKNIAIYLTYGTQWIKTFTRTMQFTSAEKIYVECKREEKYI